MIDSFCWKWWIKAQTCLVRFIILFSVAYPTGFWYCSLTTVQATERRLGCAREHSAPLVGTVAHSSWSCFFSCSSCVNYFCFVCKVKKVYGGGGEKTVISIKFLIWKIKGKQLLLWVGVNTPFPPSSSFSLL